MSKPARFYTCKGLYQIEKRQNISWRICKKRCLILTTKEIDYALLDKKETRYCLQFVKLVNSQIFSLKNMNRQDQKIFKLLCIQHFHGRIWQFHRGTWFLKLTDIHSINVFKLNCAFQSKMTLGSKTNGLFKLQCEWTEAPSCHMAKNISQIPSKSPSP